MTSTISSMNMDDIEEFSCNNCDNTFKLRRALMMHMRKNHNQQGSNGSLEGGSLDENKDKEKQGVKKIGQRHRCPTCGEAFRKLPTMLLHVREDHADEEKVQELENETEKMLFEPEKLEEDPAKDAEVGENLETTVDEDLEAEDEKSEDANEMMSKEEEMPKMPKIVKEIPVEEEEVDEITTKDSPESPMKEVEASPMKEGDEKMAEDMDDIIKMCKQIDHHDAKDEAEEEEVPKKKEEEELVGGELSQEELGVGELSQEELGVGELSQEEDDDDRSSQCKHCGVDMVIESELKKHVLLRYSNLPSLNSWQKPACPRAGKSKKSSKWLFLFFLHPNHNFNQHVGYGF